MKVSLTRDDIASETAAIRGRAKVEDAEVMKSLEDTLFGIGDLSRGVCSLTRQFTSGRRCAILSPLDPPRLRGYSIPSPFERPPRQGQASGRAFTI